MLKPTLLICASLLNSCLLAQSVLIKDIHLGLGDSSPSQITNVGADFVLFVANDGNHGQELWRSDGTSNGTFMVKDINPGMGNAYPINASGYLPIGNGNYLFRASNGTNGYEPWISDGTEVGTTMVGDFNPGSDNGVSLSLSQNFNAFGGNGSYFMVIDDPTVGLELFATDGTLAGTTLIEDVFPGVFGSNPYEFLPFQGGYLFAANANNFGRELFFLNGANISPVADINPGAPSSNPDQFFRAGNTVFFVADDGIHGEELWRFDGTPGSEELVKDIHPGSEGSQIIDLALSNGVLYFVANDGTHGFELWRSNGTEAGTQLVKDIYPGQLDGLSILSNNLIPWGDRLFFKAKSESSNTELWVTDGTPNGTQILVDSNPDGGHNPGSILKTQTHLIYSGLTAEEGYELWCTDGTPGGTRLFESFYPAGISGSPSGFTQFGDEILFRANTQSSGIELLKVNVNQFCAGANNTAFTAENIILNQPTEFSTACGSLTQIDFGCNSDPGGEMWFEFSAPQNGNVEIATGNLHFLNEGFDPTLHLFATDGTLISCVNDNGNMENELLAANGLLPGETYRIMVQGTGGQPGVLRLFVSSPECEVLNAQVGQAGECNVVTGLYDQELIITYNNAPGTGELSVNGNEFPISGSPQSITLFDLFANEEVQALEIFFTVEPTCSLSLSEGFVEIPSCYCPGDLNADGTVNSSDLLAFLSFFGCDEDCLYDFDSNGSVETADLLVMLGQIGETCP